MSELCLVTGGAGFIGSHLVDGLTAAGRRVRVLDNFSTGLRDNLAGVRPAPEIVEAELTDAAAVAAAMQGVGVVFHLGAIASVQRGLEEPALMTSLRQRHPQRPGRGPASGRARVVYAASASAYGIPTRTSRMRMIPSVRCPPMPRPSWPGSSYCQAFAASHGLQTGGCVSSTSSAHVSVPTAPTPALSPCLLRP